MPLFSLQYPDMSSVLLTYMPLQTAVTGKTARLPYTHPQKMYSTLPCLLSLIWHQTIDLPLPSGSSHSFLYFSILKYERKGEKTALSLFTLFLFSHPYTAVTPPGYLRFRPHSGCFPKMRSAFSAARLRYCLRYEQNICCRPCL